MVVVVVVKPPGPFQIKMYLFNEARGYFFNKYNIGVRYISERIKKN